MAVLCIHSDAVGFAQQAPALPNANAATADPGNGLSSTDYLRLMEQANAARGITVVADPPATPCNADSIHASDSRATR